MTREGSLDLPRTRTELLAERLGIALRGLAAELVDKRRKVAELRREIAVLRAQLACLASAPRDDEVPSGGGGGQRV